MNNALHVLNKCTELKGNKYSNITSCIRNIKIQLDIEVQKTLTIEMNKYDYRIFFVCVLLASLSS